MKRSLLALLAALALTAGQAASASGAANEEHGACISQFTSQNTGDVGETASFLAHEAHPFGTTVVALSGQTKPPCGE